MKLRYNGKIERLDHIVVSDPTYDEDVTCRYERKDINEENWNVDIDIHNSKDEYEDLVFCGTEFFLFLYKDKRFAELKDNGTFDYLRGIKLNEIEIGIDTACVALGINEKAKEINDSREEWQPECALNTLSDGLFGWVKEGKIQDDIVFVFVSGYISDDVGYSKEDIIEYLEYQFEIKELKRDKNKEINLRQETILERMTKLIKDFRDICGIDENLMQHFTEKNKYRYNNINFASSYLAGIDLRNEQRKNKNLEGEFEKSPYTEEQEKMIDEYSRLRKEFEELDRNYQKNIENELEKE